MATYTEVLVQEFNLNGKKRKPIDWRFLLQATVCYLLLCGIAWVAGAAVGIALRTL